MTNTETNDTAAAVTAPGAAVAPEKAAAKPTASRKKNAPKGRKSPTGTKTKKLAKVAKKPAGRAVRPHQETKGGRILALIGRTKGATLAELMEASSWQAHSVRGFLSTAGKKHKIDSAKNDSGQRVYRLLP